MIKNIYVSMLLLFFIILIPNFSKANEEIKTNLYIDYPSKTNIEGDTLYIDGWVMSEEANKTIKIYIDNKLRTEEILYRVRPDVIKVIKGYGTIAENTKPGFKTTLDLKELNDGMHTLKIVSVNLNNGEILAKYEKQIMVKKYKTNLYIDYPNKSEINQDTMYIDGWAMSENPEKEIKIYIDNKLRNEKLEYRARPDVIKVIKGYGTENENKTPGFKTTLNLKDISDGNHILKIETINTITNETMAVYENKFTLNKYPTTMYIDFPVQNYSTSKNEIEIAGWVMSKYPDVQIKIYVNEQLRTEQITKRTRVDVIKVINGYGTIIENPLPGFKMNLDISTWKQGTYNVKINITTQEGTILHTSKTNFIITKRTLKGIDVSHHNGEIDWQKAKNEIDFAIIRCGYGSDIKTQDDKMFYRNVQECERLGIPYGIYLYSYALNTQDAKSEVNHVLRLLGTRKPELGIWFDMEDADGYKERYNVTNQMCIDITYTFCSTLKAKGYDVGIYASYYWLDYKLNDSKLDVFPKWVAHWADKCGYKKEYVMWQYTDSGKISGINGNVDMNYYYK